MDNVLKHALRIVLTVLFAATGLAAGHALDPVSPAPATQADASAPRQLPRRVRISSAVSTGYLVKKGNPIYPDEARQQRIQGAVVLRAIVSTGGKILELTPISGDPLLTPAAIKAVKKWKYRPYVLSGQTVEMDTTIQVNFTLSGG